MLERLELKNFKSYKGIQVIEPRRVSIAAKSPGDGVEELTRLIDSDFGQHSFSSVIGPNGSGKSNLMDAISFVLGLRSSTLRSAALSDLIYRSGKEAEPESDEEPLDGMAYVKLVYVDKELETWEFQRLIANAGTSIYKVNGKATTYKVYNQQLESFNILVKAKNFLVFQGDVESLSTLSALDLSKLIERISGSLDLAAAYDLASKKLDKATEDSVAQHSRRKGINGEIKVFKELKSEKERYEGLIGQLQESILYSLLFKLYWIQVKVETKKESIESINALLPKQRQSLTTVTDQVKVTKKSVSTATKQVTKQDALIKTQLKLKEETKPTLINLQVQLKHSNTKKSSSQKFINALETELEGKVEIKKNLESDCKNVQKAKDSFEKQATKEAQAQGAHHLTEQDLKEYHQLKLSASQLEITARQSLTKINSSLQTMEAKLASQQDKLQVAVGKEELLKGKEESLSSRQTELQTKSQTTKAELTKLQHQLNDNQVKKAETAQIEAELNEKLASVLGSLQQAGADRSQSNKEAKLRETLVNLKRTFPGVIGRLCDLVKPTATKFNTAASTVLGRNNDSIVVDDEKTAISCVEYLRVQRIAHQTFLPLSTIQAKPANEKYRAFYRGTRMAIDCLEYQPAIEKAVQFACGNTLICDSMEIARTVVYEKAQDVKVVTLEGTVIHKGGNITGGVVSGGQNRQFEDREVEALRKKESELKTKLADILKNRPRGNVEEALTADITRFQSEATLLQDDLSATTDRLNNTRSELAVIKTSIKDLKTSISSLQENISELEESSIESRQAIESAEDSIFGDFCKRIKATDIREYEQKQLRGAQGSNETRLKFDSQLARLGHQIAFETKGIDSIEKRLNDYKTVITKEDETLARLETEKESMEAEVQVIEEEIETLKVTLLEFQQNVEEKTTELEEVKKKQTKLTKQLDNSLKEIAACNDEIERLASERFSIYRKCKLEEIDLPLERGSLDDVPIEEVNLQLMDVDGEEDGTQKIAQPIDHGVIVDYSTLEEDEQDPDNDYEETETRLQANITKLTSDLENMSPNMKAVAGLKDLETRFKSIDVEFEQARSNAKEAKEEFSLLKKERCEIFNKAYSHISAKIDSVYKDLTKGKASPMGGVAYLSLEDSEEPYLHGVKYHAMPPMKRFRDMEQLSGGEKTMASLALLFAIHSYHPSPFFVLDEVDAALDATNVGRIARYCKKLANPDFQFIVISLKNAFYENAAALVGIYREDGGSKAVTLDLEQYIE